VARRQPGSVFKPFVYAAGLNGAIGGNPHDVTPATTMLDEPTTFYYDDRTYQPSNFGHRFYGTVTVRQALAKSLNIPTVKIAEMAGYRSIIDLAKRAGMTMDVPATPAIALGSADATPIEVAASYSMFANRGVASRPQWVGMIRSNKGDLVYEGKAEKRPVLDPRVNYLMVSMMEEVLRSGTAAGVRARGFSLPAAGKTGTSRDGWFAGFTSKLICVVWVGYDDGQDLNLEGAKAALPIWTEFMKRAHQHREYRNVRGWDAPDGIVSVDVDPLSGQLAIAGCSSARPEVFISGTQPVELCRLHGGGGTQVAGWETGPAPTQPVKPPQATPTEDRQPSVRTAQMSPGAPSSPRLDGEPAPAQLPKEKKKGGFFNRLKGIFR
jgi:penicillin-binding protein 1B